LRGDLWCRAEECETDVRCDKVLISPPLPGHSVSGQGIDTSTTAINLVLDQKDRKAANEYEEYGCELRGYVKQLPALKDGEKMVSSLRPKEGGWGGSGED
jgi:hypothetical protein